MHKTTGDVWDPYRFEILYKSLCFACKNRRCVLGPIETSISGANHVVLQAQNHRRCVGPIETCDSGPKAAVLNAKTTDEGWDP